MVETHEVFNDFTEHEDNKTSLNVDGNKFKWNVINQSPVKISQDTTNTIPDWKCKS